MILYYVVDESVAEVIYPFSPNCETNMFLKARSIAAQHFSRPTII